MQKRNVSIPFLLFTFCLIRSYKNNNIGSTSQRGRYVKDLKPVRQIEKTNPHLVSAMNIIQGKNGPDEEEHNASRNNKANVKSAISSPRIFQGDMKSLKDKRKKTQSKDYNTRNKKESEFDAII